MNEINSTNNPELSVGQVWKTRRGCEVLVLGLSGVDKYPFEVKRLSGSGISYIVDKRGRLLSTDLCREDLVKFVRYDNQEEVKMKKERTPRKHADLIKAWADGAEIQYWDNTVSVWQEADTPTWFDDVEYRIKPKNQIRYCAVIRSSIEEEIRILPPNTSRQAAIDNTHRIVEKVLRIEIDPDTLNLVSAEMEDV